MKSKRRNMIIAGMLSVSMALGCSCFPVWAEEETEETTEDTVKNGGIENVLTADPIFTADPVQIEEEPEVVLGEGTVTEETPSFEYAYTAPRDGRYYIKVTDVSANCYIDGGVYDDLGNSVVSLWGKGDREEMIELEEGDNYTVKIEQYSIERDNTNFKVSIIAQKETTDISEVSEIKDQITFYQQKNVYTFTPKVNGNYRFEITDKTANAKFKLMARDAYDSNIMDVTAGGYEDGKTIELEADTTYTIQVRQEEGIGQYTLHICQQKERIDVSGYTEIDDSIQFTEQKNCYNFKAPVTGTYLIQAGNLRKQFGVICSVYDENSEGLSSNDFWASYDNNENYDNGVALEEGKEYLVIVSEGDGVGEYSLFISYPEEATDYLKAFQSSGNTNKEAENKEDNKDVTENKEEKADASTIDNDAEASETEQLKQENAELKAELESIKEMLKENGIVSDNEEATDN